MTNKKPSLSIDFSVSCDDYDLTTKAPADSLHISIAVEDTEDGTKRRYKGAVEPGEKADEAWGVIANRIIALVDGLPAITGDEWFDTTKWSYGTGAARSTQTNVDVDWLDKSVWASLKGYSQDFGSERPYAMLYITARGTLSLPDDEVGALLNIEPAEWFLPDYKPEDWLAHAGRFSQSSFEEGDRDWTRTQIIRGLEVAAAEARHYERMARIFEEKTGIPIPR